MSHLDTLIREHLVAIHVLDEGINVHSEQLQNIENIDNVLLFGFLTALYNYTFAIGKEKITFIDLEKYKISFKELPANRLLVIITDSLLTQKEEDELLQKIKLRYDVLTYDKDISEIESLIFVEEGIIPLELIAEIRSKGRSLPNKNKIEETGEIQSKISIPQIKTEKFFFNILLDNEFLDSEKEAKINKTLSNFFLGYKNLFFCIFAYNIENDLVVFSFGRSAIIDDENEFSMYILNETIAKTTEQTEDEPKIMKYNNKEFWSRTMFDKKKQLSYVLLSKSKNELISVDVHIKRIATFISKLLKKND